MSIVDDAKDTVRRWCLDNAGRETCGYIDRLRAQAGLTDLQIAAVLDITDGICTCCYDADSGCQCWNDD